MVLTDLDLLKVTEAAKRLEMRYPIIEERGGLVEFIQPRYSGVVEKVPVDRFDPKGSLLGSCLLYPTCPEVPEPPTGFDIGLAQFDLDQVTEVTGRNVGTGLLQVFMRCGFWNDGADLGTLGIRVIPREEIDRIGDIDREIYRVESFEEDVIAQGKIDRLRKTDPDQAESELYLHHYNLGCGGTDWLLSSYFADDYDNVPHEVADDGGPLQIVKWQEAGYEFPPTTCFSADDFNIEEVYTGIGEDPDFKVVKAAMISELPDLSVGLFATDYDDAYEVEQHPELGWRKLFHFDGPVSNAVVDVHSVYCRKTEEGFEYTGACIRTAC